MHADSMSTEERRILRRLLALLATDERYGSDSAERRAANALGPRLVPGWNGEAAAAREEEQRAYLRRRLTIEAERLIKKGGAS